MGQSIIELYKKFDKYKYVDEQSIYYKILPSLRLNQYKSDNKTFFYNWAYLSDKAQKEYIETGNIQPFNWRSGNNLWLYDIVILKDTQKVMRTLIEKFKQELKVGECINWLRLDNEDYIYRVSKKYKRSFH
tara:strand:+ start:756 stop:1148 length:393 start_codon:yes stop_codon:yes gene_type:complete